ncbi:D-isomer specific 2-hydroxyacid dehydrogenase family protein [Corynebacterium sp. H128]|uniref:D-isomer specific 2-hydroxyacid dehydrogenase family protein n=1 Tax=Corynebacterium sp. H128 TaxID=3133427 RepID=UPI0030A35E72
MKFSITPHRWSTVIDYLSENGYEETELGEADFLVFNGTPEEFPELPENIRWVQICLAGIDGFEAAGILTSDRRWANARGIFATTVAESAVALLLAQLHAHKQCTSWDARAAAEGATGWLHDKTVAIVGAGGIGTELIPMLHGFGCRVIAVNRSGRPVPGADETTTEAVWSRADYFIVAAPLTAETHHMVDAQALAEMPSHAVVVNVGRGPLIDTDALTHALETGQIAGAALDVTEPEPLPAEHPLWAMPNVVITPHIANTSERIQALMPKAILANAQAFAAGEKMPTEVTPGQGY